MCNCSVPFGAGRLVFGAVLLLFAFVVRSTAAEVQQHGLVFENWVSDTFFDGHRPDYTGKWDISAESNTRHGGLPANPKAIKYGTPVGLGDALRQFTNNEEYLLIIGYWEQEADRKRFVKIIAPRVSPQVMKKLWEPVRLEDLQRLDAVIKDRSLDYREARKIAQEIKSTPPFSEALMVVNPKIDSKGQRRLQCSLRFEDVFRYLAPDESPEPEQNPSLWGVPFPSAIVSPPRTFQQKSDPAEP